MVRFPFVLTSLLVLGATASAQSTNPGAASSTKAFAAAGLRLLAVPEAIYEHVHVPDLKPGYGVLIDQVQPDSPSAAAGLKRHDILLSFGGKALRDGAQFQRLLEATPAGKAVPLVIVRQGKTISMEAALKPAAALAVSALTANSPGYIKPGGPPAVSVEAKPLANGQLQITFSFYAEGAGKLDSVTCSGSFEAIRNQVQSLNHQKRIPSSVQDLVGVAIDRIQLLNPSTSPNR